MTPAGPRRAAAGSGAQLGWPLLILVLAALGLGAARAADSDPNVLWRIVHDRCVPDMAHFHTPLPCVAVHPRAGYALLKDRNGTTQVLLIPTARVTGIEDPAVRAPASPNYFGLAWADRGTVSALAGRALPRQDLALAVNSVFGRSQNQLHIHIDCIAPAVRAAIARQVGALGTRWAPFPVPLPGGPYLARVVSGHDLTEVNPFRLLAEGVPGARAAMGRWTLAVVGARLPPDNRPGFVLFAGQADPVRGDVGAAERLQDHTCALAREA
ncbi:MAG: CDP-diacylglycerol diphosphatase [Acetobacteraceae bacterium]